MDFETKKLVEFTMNEVKETVEIAYQRGYDNKAKEIQETVDELYVKGFENGRGHGMDEAWGYVKMIDRMSCTRLEEIFGTYDFSDIIQGTTATEAMQKIKDYEERQTEETKWFDYNYARKCSKCGSITCWTDDDGEPIPDNYCPNCGAKMRKESHEDTD